MQNKFLFLGIFEVLQKAAVPTEKRGPQNVFYRSLGACPGIFFAWWGTVWSSIYSGLPFSENLFLEKIFFYWLWEKKFVTRLCKQMRSHFQNIWCQPCRYSSTVEISFLACEILNMFFWENSKTNILKQYYGLRIAFHILQVTCLEIAKLQTLCMPMRGVNKRTCRILKVVRSSIKLQHNSIACFI